MFLDDIFVFFVFFDFFDFFGFSSRIWTAQDPGGWLAGWLAAGLLAERQSSGWLTGRRLVGWLLAGWLAGPEFLSASQSAAMILG